MPAAPHIVNGAQLKCNMSVASSSLVVYPVNRLKSSQQPAANVMDHVAMVNILPFGLCTTLTNPQVAAATSAAAGVLTPFACIPVTPKPWMPGSPTVKLAGHAALNLMSLCMCQWGGVIRPMSSGQTTEHLP